MDTAILQAEGETAVRLLVTTHTALVLIQAAVRKFKDNNPILVSAFSQEELAAIIDKDKNYTKTIAYATGASGMNLCRRISKDVASRLRQYMNTLAELPPGFQVKPCFVTCRQASKHADINA